MLIYKDAKSVLKCQDCVSGRYRSRVGRLGGAVEGATSILDEQSQLLSFALVLFGLGGCFEVLTPRAERSLDEHKRAHPTWGRARHYACEKLAARSPIL